MKISNILTLGKTSKTVQNKPFNMFGLLPTNLPSLVAAAIILTTIVVVMQKRQEATLPEVKSVAWYMANPQEALAKNKECYDNPALKATENCQYSLQALEVMHKGPNS